MPRAGRYYYVDFDAPKNPLDGELSWSPEESLISGRSWSVGLVVNGTPKQHRARCE